MLAINCAKCCLLCAKDSAFFSRAHYWIFQRVECWAHHNLLAFQISSSAFHVTRNGNLCGSRIICVLWSDFWWCHRKWNFTRMHFEVSSVKGILSLLGNSICRVEINSNWRLSSTLANPGLSLACCFFSCTYIYFNVNALFHMCHTFLKFAPEYASEKFH